MEHAVSRPDSTGSRARKWVALQQVARAGRGHWMLTSRSAGSPYCRHFSITLEANLCWLRCTTAGVSTEMMCCLQA